MSESGSAKGVVTMKDQEEAEERVEDCVERERRILTASFEEGRLASEAALKAANELLRRANRLLDPLTWEGGISIAIKEHLASEEMKP